MQIFLYSLGSRLYTMQEEFTESSLNGKYKKSSDYSSRLEKSNFYIERVTLLKH